MAFIAPSRRALLVAITLASTVACDNPLSLPQASLSNVVDTVTLYALRGTLVSQPSGYDLATKQAVRTDLTGFDFAFDIAGGLSSIVPAGALHLDKSPGILPLTQSFDSVTVAPDVGYLDSLPVGIAPGSVFVVRSRPSSSICVLTSILSVYGKFHVLAIDSVQRTLKLEALVNQNCGYRSLQPGTPTA